MVRRPRRPQSEETPSTPSEPSRPRSAGTNREKIVEAYFELLGEQPYEEIGFGDIAARAGLTLVEVRDEFGSTIEIIAAHMKAIDRTVLTGGEPELAEEPPRERLFDVLMRRFEALAPYKSAVRSLLRSAETNPPLALALNCLAVRSQLWMLTAADIGASGPLGMMRAQGLALLYARVLRTFVKEDDPSLPRTMAALDRDLGRGARWANLLDDLCRFRPSRFLCRRRAHRHEDDRDLGEEPVAI
jgi:AcrR family transcriptional regulator